jgi:endonuclease/exonuclease/phosphatase family metal-dependent hydrolase
MEMISRLFWLMLSCAVATAETPTELRVLTWNLHHGEGLDGKLDLERIAKRIVETKPDLVALQEVDQNARRSGGVDQAAVLAKLTGMNGVFGKAMDFDGGGYGQAILSRFPIEETHVHRLPGSGEPRIAFEVKITSAGRGLRFLSVHLDAQHAAKRQAQAQALREALAAKPEPTILAGDFNDGPKSSALAVFAAPWKDVGKAAESLTFPSDKPAIDIDHILIKGLAAREPATVVAEPVASDHRPVAALLLWEKPSVAAD